MAKIKPIRYMTNMENFTFAKCGLDADLNFLQAPTCPCGCSGKDISILLETRQDVVNACGGLLLENECCCCAIFVIFTNGDIMMAFKMGYDEEDLSFYTMRPKDGVNDYTIIGQLAEEFDFHICGLMVERAPGQYMIVEE